MKTNWILTSAGAAIIGGIITYFITGSWEWAVLSAIVIFILVWLANPKTRYMRAFYIIIVPLLNNFYFIFQAKTSDVGIEAGVKEPDIATTLILGIIATICLILDYLERNGKLEGNFLSIKKNSVGNISGNNNQINQS